MTEGTGATGAGPSGGEILDCRRDNRCPLSCRISLFPPQGQDTATWDLSPASLLQRLTASPSPVKVALPLGMGSGAHLGSSSPGNLS